MKKVKRTIIIALTAAFVGTAMLGLASCVKEEDVNSAIDPVKTEVSALSDSLDALETKLETLEIKLAEVNGEIEALDGELENLDGELSSLKTALEENKTLLEGEIKSLKSEIQLLKEADAGILADVATLETKVEGLEQSVQNLQTTVQAVTARVEKNESDIAGILERLDALEKENAILKACLNGEHELTISYEWTETDCTALFSCGNCAHVGKEKSSTFLGLGGYREATFENEALEKQIYGHIDEAVIDATELSAEEIGEMVSLVLSLGGRNIHTVLKEEASYAELYAIRLAIEGDEEVADESVHLTLAGILELPNHDSDDETKYTFGSVSKGGDSEDFKEISTLTLPDATTVGDRSFYHSSVSKLVAPNLETVGEYAFQLTKLTDIDLPKLTTAKDAAFSTPTIKTIKLPSVTTLEDSVFWLPSNIESVELTAKEEIVVGWHAFDPGFTNKIDLVLHGNRRSQVVGNTWTPKQSDGTDNPFQFKSITFVGAEHDETTNTYYAYTASDLQEWNEVAQEDLTANLVLKEDIVLTGENNFKTIGLKKEKYYKGTVDGEGHSITGLHIDQKANTVAMIYALDIGATVKNLTFIDATLKGETIENSWLFMGVICGMNNGTVENCKLLGNSTVSATGVISYYDVYMGGFIGWNDGIVKDFINEATVTSSVEGGSQQVGGICGTAGGRLENCVNKGAVMGEDYVGGIAGRCTNSVIVVACLNEGTVTGNGSVGGIAGEVYNCTIVACANTGTVTGNGSVGGIAGEQDMDCILNGCWTVDSPEMANGVEITENKNGIGSEYNAEEIVACFIGDAAKINAAVTELNEAIQAVDYRWIAGENGEYPTLFKRVEVTVALKEDAQTSVYFKDDLTVDLSSLLEITEGAGEVTYTLTGATGSIVGSTLSCPLQGDYEIRVTVAETVTHKSATFTFVISVLPDLATGSFDGEWVTS